MIIKQNSTPARWIWEYCQLDGHTLASNEIKGYLSAKLCALTGDTISEINKGEMIKKYEVIL